MVDAWLPYGKTEVCAHIPTRNFLGLIEPKKNEAVQDIKGEIKRALTEPIGSKTLDEIVKPEHKVSIVIGNHLPADLTNVMVLSVVDYLNSVGVKDENITVIYGCETLKTGKEDFLGKVKTVVHNPRKSKLVNVGKTHGINVYLNRVFTEADVKILLGRINFHCYAGYTGDGKIVLPGVCGEETIKRSHALLLNSRVKKGVLNGNPIHEVMVETARLANVDFILNVVANSEGGVVKAFAGSLEEAFNYGVKFVDEVYRLKVDRKADIVVVSAGGYPEDSTLYNAYEGIESALNIVKRGGVIVLVAECSEGYGNQTFYDWMVRLKEIKNVEKEIKRNYVLGGHAAYYLLKALQKVHLILVSAMPDYYVNSFKFKTARAVNDGVEEAFNIVGKKAKVWIVPYGNVTLPELETKSS